jgi:hypothetical protein
MIIVTGASQNHYYTLLQFIYSFFTHSREDIFLIVYNLGINEDNWNELINFFNLTQNNSSRIIFKIFDYSKYPSFVNININYGEYAWKPIIIHETFLQYELIDPFICWMDSGTIIGNYIHHSIDLSFPFSSLNKNITIKNSHNTIDWDKFIHFLQNNGIYSGVSSGNISRWTHPSTLSFMNCPVVYLKKQNRNASFIAFNTNIVWVKSFISEFFNLSINKKCIAPEGSSRQNHRQDQSVFTILYYKYQNRYFFDDNTFFYNNIYTIHNDID